MHFYLVFNYSGLRLFELLEMCFCHKCLMFWSKHREDWWVQLFHLASEWDDFKRLSLLKVKTSVTITLFSDVRSWVRRLCSCSWLNVSIQSSRFWSNCSTPPRRPPVSAPLIVVLTQHLTQSSLLLCLFVSQTGCSLLIVPPTVSFVSHNTILC